MGKMPLNSLPVAFDTLLSKSQNLDLIKQSLQSVNDKQKASFDNKLKSKELLLLHPTDPVGIMRQQRQIDWIPGVIVRHHKAPRSNMVQIGNRQLRRNRKHIRFSTHNANETIDDQPDDRKLHVESSHKERSQVPTSLTQVTINKTVNTDAPKSFYQYYSEAKHIRSGRLVIQRKKLDL